MRLETNLDELLKLEAKATQGHWDEFDIAYYGDGEACLEVRCGLRVSKPNLADFELIVEMRNSIRHLLLELKASRKVVEAAEAFLAVTQCDGTYSQDCHACNLTDCLKNYYRIIRDPQKLLRELESGEK